MSLNDFYDAFNAHVVADSSLKNFAQTNWRKALTHVDGDVALKELNTSVLPVLITDIGAGEIGGEVLGDAQYTNLGVLQCALVWSENDPAQAAQQRRGVIAEMVQAVLRGGTYSDTVSDARVINYEPLNAAHNPNMRVMRFVVAYELDEVVT